MIAAVLVLAMRSTCGRNVSDRPVACVGGAFAETWDFAVLSGGIDGDSLAPR